MSYRKNQKIQIPESKLYAADAELRKAYLGDEGGADGISDSINVPGDVQEVQSVDFTNYGGKGASQQSVVFTLDYEDYDGEYGSVDIQPNLDPEHGVLIY